MKLIVGLGNPGIEYQFTPHNLGFLTIDRIANGLGIEVRNRQCRALTARAMIAGEQAVLAKPETYMNLSGLSVRELVAEHQVDVTRDLIVIYDELDLPLGAIRIRQRGSSAGHNGMESILSALGTDELLRIRLGIAPDRKVADMYGAQSLIPGKVARSVFVINGQGVITYRDVRPLGLFKPKDDDTIAAIRAARE